MEMTQAEYICGEDFSQQDNTAEGTGAAYENNHCHFELRTEKSAFTATKKEKIKR